MQSRFQNSNVGGNSLISFFNFKSEENSTLVPDRVLPQSIVLLFSFRNSSDGKPFYYKARGLMNIWALKNNATRQQGRNDVDEIAMDWEEVNIY